MSSSTATPTYDNISQRAVDSYRKALVPFESNEMDAQTESRRQLHYFLAALYDFMFENPASFGMSGNDDDWLEVHEQGGNHNSAVLRKLKQQRKKITTTVDLLRSLGEHGRLKNGNLVIPIAEYREMLTTTPRVLAKCIAGLGEVGLIVEERDGEVVVGNGRFPEMMTALTELAHAPKTRQETKLGYICFARCDYGSLREDYQPSVDDAFSYLDSYAHGQAMKLHGYMLDTGYNAKVERYHVGEWELDYQGPRKIKSTQLVRVRYDERYREQTLVFVLCAAANRLIPHLIDAPERALDDFRQRVCECTKCGWCKNKKSLGPAKFDDKDGSRTICWYTTPYVGAINDENMQLVRDYVRWHEALAGARSRRPARFPQ